MGGHVDIRKTPEINENVETNYNSNLLNQPYNSTTEKLLDLLIQKIGTGSESAENPNLLNALIELINSQKTTDFYIDDEGQWLNVIREKYAYITNNTLGVQDIKTISPFEPLDIQNQDKVYGAFRNPFNLQFAKQQLYRLDGNLNKNIAINNGVFSFQRSLTGTSYQVVFKTTLSASYFSPYNINSVTTLLLSNSSLIYAGAVFNVQSVNIDVNTYELTVIFKNTNASYNSSTTVVLSVDLVIGFDFETDNGKVRFAYSFKSSGFFGGPMGMSGTSSVNNLEIKSINTKAISYIPNIDALSPKENGNPNVILTNVAGQEMIITYFVKIEKFRFLEIRFLPTQTQHSDNYMTIDFAKKVKFSSLEDVKTFKHTRGFESCINVVREHLYIEAHANTQIEIKVII
jgi:hypothetical protein